MLFYLLSIQSEENKDKFEYIYKNFHDTMISFAQYRLQVAGVDNYELEAEDVVQDALFRIVKYIDKITIYEDIKYNRTYILTILSNTIYDYLSKKEYCESFDEDSCKNGSIIQNEPDFISNLKLQERYDDVKRAVAMLGERYQIVFALRYGANKSIKEIAEILQTPVGTIYTRLERGQRMLLEILEVNKNG